MTFVYQGFTQDHDRRCFTFSSAQPNPVSVFAIEVDLPLLLKNRVAMQEGPALCLQILNTASVAGPDYLERLHRYRVVEADLRPILAERERRATEKSMKKPPRRPFRKPSVHSNVALATNF